MPKVSTAKKRNEAQKEADKWFVFNCRLKGYTYTKIVELIKQDEARPYTLSRGQIYGDYDAALNEYKKTHIQDLESEVAKHIATYDLTIEYCFKQLERLEKPIKQVKQKVNEADEVFFKEQLAKEQISGAQFIAQIHSALQAKERLLGMQKPIKIEEVVSIKDLNVEQIAALKKIQDSIGSRASVENT